jgi:hypothetical protein
MRTHDKVVVTHCWLQANDADAAAVIDLLEAELDLLPVRSICDRVSDRHEVQLRTTVDAAKREMATLESKVSRRLHVVPPTRRREDVQVTRGDNEVARWHSLGEHQCYYRC